jgi:hypothetical protein
MHRARGVAISRGCRRRYGNGGLDRVGDKTLFVCEAMKLFPVDNGTMEMTAHGGEKSKPERGKGKALNRGVGTDVPALEMEMESSGAIPMRAAGESRRPRETDVQAPMPRP